MVGKDDARHTRSCAMLRSMRAALISPRGLLGNLINAIAVYCDFVGACKLSMSVLVCGRVMQKSNAELIPTIIGSR